MSFHFHPDREYLPIPQVLEPLERVCFQISLPHDSEHLAAFWGAIQALAKSYTWGTPRQPASFTVADYWLDIITENRVCYEEALFMANSGCGCCPETIFRYGADGLQEFSTDNGATWDDFPGDERISGSILPPPLWLIVGDDNKCNGAITARLNVKAIVDQILDSGEETFVGLVAVVVGAVCVMTAGTVCAVATLVGVLVGSIIKFGFTVFGSAMTTQVYDDFQCILFCHIGLDASFTAGQWEGVKQDIVDFGFDENAEAMLWNLVNSLGPVGLTNVARNSILVSGDCDDCPPCDPCESAFAVVGEIEDHPDEFTWIFSSADDGFGQQVVIVQFGSGGQDQCCCIVDYGIAGFAPFHFYRVCGSPDQTAGEPESASIWEFRVGTGVGGGTFGLSLTLEVCPE